MKKDILLGNKSDKQAAGGSENKKNSNGTDAVSPEDAEVLEFMQNSIYRDEPAEAELESNTKFKPGENPWEGKFDRRSKPR